MHSPASGATIEAEVTRPVTTNVTRFIDGGQDQWDSGNSPPNDSRFEWFYGAAGAASQTEGTGNIFLYGVDEKYRQVHSWLAPLPSLYMGSTSGDQIHDSDASVPLHRRRHWEGFRTDLRDHIIDAETRWPDLETLGFGLVDPSVATFNAVTSRPLLAERPDAISPISSLLNQLYEDEWYALLADFLEAIEDRDLHTVPIVPAVNNDDIEGSATDPEEGLRRFVIDLHSALDTEPFEYGLPHPAEQIVARALKNSESSSWIAYICENQNDPVLAAVILRCLGFQNNLPGTIEWRCAIIKAALDSLDPEVRLAGVQASENWREPALLEILKIHVDSDGSISEYIQDMLEALGA